MKNGQTVGYRRVSSASQCLDRQELEGCDRLFEENASGASRDKRPALQQMIAYVRQGDEVIVHSIDRLARSLQDLQGIIDELTAKGVRIRFIKESLVFGGSEEDPAGKLMLQVLGAISEFERTLIRNRQAEGIEAAKKRKGYRHGRKPTVDKEAVINAWEAAPASSLADLAGEVGCSRSTVHRILSGHEAYIAADKRPAPRSQ